MSKQDESPSDSPDIIEMPDVDQAAESEQAAAEPLSELEQLQVDIAESQDRVLRTTAELENVRKRMRRELDTERRYADLPMMRELLPVLDNIQRAIEAAEKGGDSGGLLEGFKLVAQQLESVLQKRQCTRIEALGTAFDPHFHEAVSHLPNPDAEPGTVMVVTSEGYLLHDRVVRPAQVVVAAAASSAE